MNTATKPRTKLDGIAVDMFSRCATPGAGTHRKLSNGLELVLQHTDEQHWRLAMAREDVYPGDQEVAICRAAFGVPDAAEEVRGQKVRAANRTNRVLTYHRVEIVWMEYRRD